MILSLFRSPPKKSATLKTERSYEVAGRVLPLRVMENPRATRLTLRIDAGGKGLRMTVPPGMPTREIDKFLTRHEGWIETRIAKMPDQPKVRPGVKIPVRGVPHLIVHEFRQTRNSPAGERRRRSAIDCLWRPSASGAASW